MKILSIGNSFSQDAQRYLFKLAEANGKELFNANLFIGGCPLELHCKNIDEDAPAYQYQELGEATDQYVGIKETLLKEKWDYVTLQEASIRSFVAKGFTEFLPKLASYVRELVPSAKILLHKTWSYPPQYVQKNTEFTCTTDMYSRIERVYEYAKDLIGADGIIPSGETLERLMNRGYVAHRDTHAGYGLGRLALGFTWYEVLFGEPAKEFADIELDEHVRKGLREIALECAHEAVMNIGNYYYPAVTSFDVPYIRIPDVKNPRQTLDVYYPDCESYPVFVYFHGGGLQFGDKRDAFAEKMSKYLNDRGIAYVSANYRMFPNANYPDFVRDAASAVAWVKNNLPAKGANGKIFVGGSSAGGYLSMMLCFDRTHLGYYDIEPETISGYIHDAGQPTTHFTVLKSKGIDQRRVIIDDTAPIYHVGEAKEYAPMIIINAEFDIENRRKQTELLLSTMSHFGYDMSKVKTKLFEGYKHCGYISEDGVSEFGKLVVDFISEN